MQKNIKTAVIVIVSIIVLCGLSVSLYFFFSGIFSEQNWQDSWISKVLTGKLSLQKPIEITSIKKFDSEEDFKNYLEKTGSISAGVGGGAMKEMSAITAPVGMGQADSSAIDRVSETNTQVLGIDEPDMLKTDGKIIYFSPSFYYRYWGPLVDEKILPPYENSAKVKLISALPPSDMKIVSEIKDSGDLLLSNGILAVFNSQNIIGYNVSNVKSPEKKWTVKLEGNNYIITSRLYKDKIYLVEKTSINSIRPCPFRALSLEGGKSLEIKCSDIYHPTTDSSIDSVYTAVILDPKTGDIEKNISFVGSEQSSAVYMSENAIFVTYYYTGDIINFFADFFDSKCRDIIPQSVVLKLRKLNTYDISNAAKMTEFYTILERYSGFLDQDEQLKIQNEMKNRMSDFYSIRKRDMERTGIIKIGVDSLEVEAAGEVPGTLLNQFSLDEYNGNLRVATTIGQNFWWGFGGLISGQAQSVNDVYVLDGNLQKTGFVKNLGQEERIYSVRFIGDRGYLVTFKQIDPFFVLDLSDPKNPQLKGELKIPGYSSYLHPMDKNTILGIGQESSNVKVSLFDVSSPENPKELSKYTLDEYWTDISNNHHAFLLDKSHKIFFVPGGKGGYIFSYEDNKLKLIKAVSGFQAKRAAYINNYLYIVSEQNITAINETNWKKEGELDF